MTVEEEILALEEKRCAAIDRAREYLTRGSLSPESRIWLLSGEARRA